MKFRQPFKDDNYDWLKKSFVTRDEKAFKDSLPDCDYDLVLKLIEEWYKVPRNEYEFGSSFGRETAALTSNLISFYKKIFEEVKPKNILEVGTHMAGFCYIAKKENLDAKIWTFGIDPESNDCVNVLNNYFNSNDIKFIQGDSLRTLPDFKEEINFDLAHVDGSHNWNWAWSDLEQCARLNIKTIILDDSHMYPVNEASYQFCDKFNYEIKEIHENYQKGFPEYTRRNIQILEKK